MEPTDKPRPLIGRIEFFADGTAKGSVEFPAGYFDGWTDESATEDRNQDAPHRADEAPDPR